MHHSGLGKCLLYLVLCHLQRNGNCYFTVLWNMGNCRYLFRLRSSFGGNLSAFSISIWNFARQVGITIDFAYFHYNRLSRRNYSFARLCFLDFAILLHLPLSVLSHFPTKQKQQEIRIKAKRTALSNIKSISFPSSSYLLPLALWTGGFIKEKNQLLK